MFTKEAYENYFGQIARVERKMLYGVSELGRLIKDPSMGGVLKKIGDDEVRHYDSVLRMLELTRDPDQPEHRREAREYCLGTIRLRSVQDPGAEEINAQCVNLSASGICLECSKNLSSSGAWDLVIRLFDKDEIMVRRGHVVWSKEVEPDFYLSGIEFDE